MAKRDKGIYAPGELSRVREKLGVFDKEEAEILAKKLGGEVGYERSNSPEPARQQGKRGKIGAKDRPSNSGARNRPYLLDADDTISADIVKSKSTSKKDRYDDPSVVLRPSYWDRIKMDKYAAQPEFDVKSSTQVFYSMISLFSDPPDYVSQQFVKFRMPEYYKRIETLVTSTRSLFPRNNMMRNERMKKTAPIAFSILDVIRYWDIEKISGDLGRIQMNPKSSRVSDFTHILRAVYKPLFILEQLDLDTHIRAAYKVLYKLLYLENPIEAEKKYQELIRSALSAFSGIRQNVRHLMYPLLMKAVSPTFVPYSTFFQERRNRIMSFLGVSEDERIIPAEIAMQGDAKDLKAESESPSGEAQDNQDPEKKESAVSGTGQGGAKQEVKEEISEEEKARRLAEEVERKAVNRGLQTLEALFPKAGWDRLSSYPDLFPYFADIFGMKRGVVFIAPTDPMQQIFVLMHIMEELLFAIRHVSFSITDDGANNIENIDSFMSEIANSWRHFMEESFGREYLPRLSEYIRILEGSPEERTSMYGRKVVTELHWLKRLYFLPFYKFESLVPPPFRKGEFGPIYPKIKTMRRYFNAVVVGIEQGTRVGGAETNAHCDGIDNPWAPYVFEVPNPVSMRMDALLAPKARNNASLIFFCAAITSVLDHLLNNEKSWAYTIRSGPVFRSVNGEGIVPITGVDDRVDVAALFKQSIKQRQKNKEA